MSPGRLISSINVRLLQDAGVEAAHRRLLHLLQVSRAYAGDQFLSEKRNSKAQRPSKALAFSLSTALGFSWAWLKKRFAV